VPKPLTSLVENRSLVICSGAGGVGKTTTSAAIGLAAALGGRRAVVLTIDPARRLANALGLSHLPNEPVPIEGPLLEGAAPEGSLHALMLDPKQTFDALVRRLHAPEEAERLFQNRLYQNVSGMIAGMQEYTAGEKLHELAHDPRFDLVVLDTPPTRNALDFLQAPTTLSRFLDERVLRWFLPGPRPRNPLLRRTGKLVGGALGKIFGEGFAEELGEFLATLGELTTLVRRHAEEVRALLASPSARFLLVTSPLDEALDEALYFHERLRELGFPFGGYVINRVHPERPPIDHQEVTSTRAALAEILGEERASSAMGRLESWYDRERERALADRRALGRLRDLGEVPTVGIPLLEEAADERILRRMVEAAFDFR
jgi:anion-transporting  ArsA/GET3 family ATPase